MELKPKKEIVDIWIIDPFNELINNSKASGIVLFASAFIALVIANSPLAEAYHHFWENKFSIGFNGNYINKTLHHWINDGLMALFFFVVGLELKRELVAGELRSPRNAALPITAAVGGMIVPALIYLIINSGNPAATEGWGVPMATDIAFALGILYLLGDKVPSSLKIFLTAIAIVDDLGAVLVIAFFYTSEIVYESLAIAGVVLLVMIAGNRIGIRNTVFYGVLGVGGLWLEFLLSGVHATIAAVLAAFTIPATTNIQEKLFLGKSKKLMDKFEAIEMSENDMVSYEQYKILSKMRDISKRAIPPLQRLEHGLHPIVSFVVMPIFALSNAGITLSGNILDSLVSTITLGVIAGLIVGKFLGVVGVSYVVIKLKLMQLPKGMSMKQLVGVGFLTAIGFTMSLFISELAFKDIELRNQAKFGVLIASILASIIGFVVLNLSLRKQAMEEAALTEVEEVV
jgi:NhaA family Na+:H+ antiporter